MIIVKLKGGFCNNLFQYATAKALAKRIGGDVKLDIDFFKGSNYEDIYRFGYLNIEESFATPEEIKKLSNKEAKSVAERIIRKTKLTSPYNKRTHFIENHGGLAFDKRLFNLKGDVYLDGWFTDENYFKDIREIILREFEVKNPLSAESQGVLNKISNTNSISVHIRRGAFVTNTFFGALPLEYYYRAVAYMNTKLNDPHFFIFSDDTAWVLQNLQIEGNTTIVHHNSSIASEHHTQKDYEDLTLMKNCKHNIMAHSTFSWWGAWLNKNPNKIVIAPIKALNDPNAQKHYESGNYIPSSWIKI